MFKKSTDATQQDIFSSIPSMLKGSSVKKYNNEKAWHNVFRVEVVDRVNEQLFSPLFDETMGAPNASVRILVGMMALKEGFGWSDNELFEQCQFNLLVRCALGLFNINDSLPAESTYYLFRNRIHEYQRRNSVDIIEEVFRQITKGQVIQYQVSGRSIRMDSKLIGSNIAWCTRYEIIHDTLCMFYKGLKTSVHDKIPRELRLLLKETVQTESGKVVFRLSREEIHERLQSLGILIYRLLSVIDEKQSKYYNLLKRVFEEQYSVDKNQVEIRPKEDIKSDSIQSPHDTECAYRHKDSQSIKGYSANITETCDKDLLNLIVDVQVSAANTPDVEFLQSAVNASNQILECNPEGLHADGAYQSPDNMKFCRENEITPYITGMQGFAGRFDLDLNGEILTVTDKKTGEVITARKARSIKSKSQSERWFIKTQDGKVRYFAKKEIETYQVRKELASIPLEKRNMRNNVEATIFQFAFHANNSKTRYRGLLQNKMWATLRCIWLNMKRIVAYVESVYQRTLKIRNIIGNRLVFRQKIRYFLFHKNISILFCHQVPIFSYYQKT